MKRSHRLATLALALAFVAAGVALVLTSTTAAQPPREEQWKKVDAAVAKGLPKTAIEHLNPIIDGAMKDKNYPEAIKAIAGERLSPVYELLEDDSGEEPAPDPLSAAMGEEEIIELIKNKFDASEVVVDEREQGAG